MITKLKDNLLRMPSIQTAKQEISEIKQDTGQPTLKAAIEAKQTTIVTAPVSQVASEILQTTMKSGVLLGEGKTRYINSIIDNFEDTGGIDTSRSSNYTFDSVLKAVRVAN